MKWVAANPVLEAEPPATPKANPHSPSAADAARILNHAWGIDEDWGTLIWLAMTSGARRGELCALRWAAVDLDNAVITLKQAIASDGDSNWFIKDTKTHQQRRVVLDPETVEVLKEHRARYEGRARRLE